MAFLWCRFLTTVVLYRQNWVCLVPAVSFDSIRLCSGSVPCSLSTYRAPIRRLSVPIYKVLAKAKPIVELQTYQQRGERTYVMFN